MQHRRHRHPDRVNFRRLATFNHEPIDRVAYKLLNHGVSPPPTDIRQIIERYAAAGIRGRELVTRVNNSIVDGKWSSTLDYIKREHPQYIGRLTTARIPRPRRIQKRQKKQIPRSLIEMTRELDRATALPKRAKKNKKRLKTVQCPVCGDSIPSHKLEVHLTCKHHTVQRVSESQQSAKHKVSQPTRISYGVALALKKNPELRKLLD